MRILFVCSGNTCRSPMAQVLFEKISQEQGLDVQCFGAGIMTVSGLPASDNSKAAMKEIGIDISNYKSTDIKSINLNDFDLIVPMTINHAHALVEYGVDKKKIYLFDTDVSDPYGGSLEVYKATRDELVKKLEKLADFVKVKFNP